MYFFTKGNWTNSSFLSTDNGFLSTFLSFLYFSSLTNKIYKGLLSVIGFFSETVNSRYSID